MTELFLSWTALCRSGCMRAFGCGVLTIRVSGMSFVSLRADVKEWRWRRASSWWRTPYRKAVTSLQDGHCDSFEDSKVDTEKDAIGREQMTRVCAAACALYCRAWILFRCLRDTLVPELYVSAWVVLQWLSCTSVAELYLSAWVVRQCLNCTSVPELYFSGWVVLQWLSCTSVPELYVSAWIVLQCLSCTSVPELYFSAWVVRQCLNCTRWFKYDRDKLWLVYTQIVPVIFEPPCTSVPELYVSAWVVLQCLSCSPLFAL